VKTNTKKKLDLTQLHLTYYTYVAISNPEECKL